MQKIESSVKSAKEIVMEYTQATERLDFQSARGYLRDNLSYVSPLNSFDSAEPYLKYNLHLYETGQLAKFDIKKEFADSNDVCILHEWNSQLVCVWYHVDDDGKISSIKVIFIDDHSPQEPSRSSRRSKNSKVKLLVQYCKVILKESNKSSVLTDFLFF